MSDQDDLNLNALLVLVTNQDQVAENIKNLISHKTEAQSILKTVEDKQAQADLRYNQAKQIEDQNNVLSESLRARAEELQRKEQHWLEKNDKQIANEKSFNEEKLEHEGNVRQLEIDRAKLVTDINALEDQKTNIKKIEDEAVALRDEAGRLRDEHASNLESLQAVLAAHSGKK